MSNDGGGIGTSMGGLEFSPDRKKRDAQKRKRQEKYWASRSGEVEVSRIEPDQPVTQEKSEHD